MRLSILDQAPILPGQNVHEALETAIELAVKGETYGYHRYWIAEHHDLPGLACPAPEAVLGVIGAKTTKIRLGPGAVLLPYYQPFKIAEIYHTLAALFQGRIDIGLGRAPGGSAEATNALTNRYLEQVWKFPDQVEELLAFVEDRADSGNEYASLTAMPFPKIPPSVWILGTGKKSAALAAEKGLAYAYGEFMGDPEGIEWAAAYREQFIPRRKGEIPHLIVAVSAFCAKTDKEAERIINESLSNKAKLKSGSEGENRMDEKLSEWKNRTIFGDPIKVANALQILKSKWNADEIMICSNFGSARQRLDSYRLIAEAIRNL